MPPPQDIVDLIERFAHNIDAYKTGRYNETQLRREFIDPFFTALGWDVDNRAGHAEAYKDVIHEDAIRIGAATKAPDYCFRIGGTRKFFIEAKKPSIDIKDDPHPAFQLRRYAWSAKLPLSILTDFEEFAVYDCRIRPKKTDRASTARVKYINYTEYVERWDEIEPVFSHDAILKGSFDKYAQSARSKKGTAEVDAAFLDEIESWREILAKNIALRNPDLTNRQLNFAVQKTIDRIIFLGLLNSRLMTFYHRKRYLDEFKMRFQKILIKDCRRFPIRALDLTDPTDKSRHDKMGSLVQTMLDLNKALQNARTPNEKTALQRQITATNSQIDQLVYQLYNLTKEEIEIVEEATAQ